MFDENIGASQVALVVKNLLAKAGDMRQSFDPWAGKIPWRRAWQPAPVFLHGKSLQSCATLCDPRDCSPPGSSVHGILQARILEWVAISSYRDLPNPGIEPTSLTSPALAGGFFTTSASWETICPPFLLPNMPIPRPPTKSHPWAEHELRPTQGC